MQEVKVESNGAVESVPLISLSSTMYYGTVGGGGGDPFDAPLTSLDRITTIDSWSGSWMDSFTFESAGGRKVRVGGGGGTRREGFLLPDWQYIHGITLRYGSYVDYIKFHIWNMPTKESFVRAIGNSSSTATEYELIFQPDPDRPRKEVCGFGGRAHQYLDAIGIYARDR